MNELTIALLSGLIGAIIGSVIVIIYTEFKTKREREVSLAREKLDRLYGPIVSLIKRTAILRGHEGSFDIWHNKEESDLIDNMIIKYFYLLDDDLKEDFILLHSTLRYNISNQIKFPDILSKIHRHYIENKKILGIK